MNAKENGNEPANTVLVNDAFGGIARRSTGLTKRELFAAMAMQGLIGCRNGWSADHIAAGAREAADALLAELEKPE